MNQTSTPNTAKRANGEGTMPLRIEIQYVKDLSFESPRAPMSLQQSDRKPSVEVQVDVKASKRGDTAYEVILNCNVNGSVNGESLFLVELSYAGIFTITGIAENQVQPVLLIECPRFLFPFARNIIASVTRDGGFPPLLIQPIDFAMLYANSLRQKTEQNPDSAASRPS